MEIKPDEVLRDLGVEIESAVDGQSVEARLWLWAGSKGGCTEVASFLNISETEANDRVDEVRRSIAEEVLGDSAKDVLAHRRTKDRFNSFVYAVVRRKTRVQEHGLGVLDRAVQVWAGFLHRPAWAHGVAGGLVLGVVVLSIYILASPTPFSGSEFSARADLAEDTVPPVAALGSRAAVVPEATTEPVSGPGDDLARLGPGPAVGPEDVEIATAAGGGRDGATEEREGVFEDISAIVEEGAPTEMVSESDRPATRRTRRRITVPALTFRELLDATKPNEGRGLGLVAPPWLEVVGGAVAVVRRARGDDLVDADEADGLIRYIEEGHADQVASGVARTQNALEEQFRQVCERWQVDCDSGVLRSAPRAEAAGLVLLGRLVDRASRFDTREAAGAVFASWASEASAARGP